PNASNATLYDKLNFNFIRDIAPVAGISRDTFAIEVNPSVPVKTVPELIAHAKVNSGKINMASGGIGSGNHIFGELFKMMTGVNLVHVPYRGAGPALVDLLGRQVQGMFASISSSIEYVRAGKLRGGDNLDALTSAAGHPDGGRIRARLRGELLDRRRRTEGHADRARRETQPRDQCRPRRFPDEGAACRVGRRRTSRLSRRLRQAHRRGNREVGQGGEVRGHQATVSRISSQIFRNVPRRSARRRGRRRLQTRARRLLRWICLLLAQSGHTSRVA